MNRPPTPLPAAPTLWLLVCVYLNCAGWVLSATGQLNATGYLVVVVAGLAAAWAGRNQLRGGGPWRRWRPRRWRRALPAAYAGLAALVFLGGVLYAPTNYDGMAYRVPRILYWLEAGHWEWIHTTFQRLNTRSCGWEWVAAPLLALTRTDRLLFLVNGISFLLLPGLFFSVLTRLGVARRAAAEWMWLLAGGYCYTLQAASVGNDLFCGLFALLALDAALRARADGSPRNFWISILAAAMMTGAKSSTIPLGLPWLWILLPALPLLWRRPGLTVAWAVPALLASFLPMAALDQKYCGDWTGEAAEHLVIGNGDPLLHIGHNLFVLGTENLVPPVFPLAAQWNQLMIRLIPASLAQAWSKTFEKGAAELRLPEMQIEENAGLGCGLTLLLLASAGAAWRLGRAGGRTRPGGAWRGWFQAANGVAVLPFLIKGSFTTTARLFNPYYAYLVPALLGGPAHAAVVRRPWWRGGALVVCGLSALLLIISPARPLWPVQTILAKVGADRSGRLWQRARTVYSVYANRPDAFHAALAALPADAGRTIGLVTWDDPELALWKPFGQRRFRHVLDGDTVPDLRRAGIRYVLVSQDKFSLVIPVPVADWIARLHGRVVQKIPLTLRAEVGPVEWLLVDLGPKG